MGKAGTYAEHVLGACDVHSPAGGDVRDAWATIWVAHRRGRAPGWFRAC